MTSCQLSVECGFPLDDSVNVLNGESTLSYSRPNLINIPLRVDETSANVEMDITVGAA